MRKLAHIKYSDVDVSFPYVPISLVSSVVSVSLGGAEERDRVYRACLAVLCEIGKSPNVSVDLR